MEAYTKLIWGTLAPPQVHLQCVDDGNGPTRDSLLHGTIIRIPPGVCLHACINALDPARYISQTGHRAHCSRTSVDRRCILWAHIGQTCRQCCLCVEPIGYANSMAGHQGHLMVRLWNQIWTKHARIQRPHQVCCGKACRWLKTWKMLSYSCMQLHLAYRGSCARLLHSRDLSDKAPV